jgi:hypothetical protein
MHGDSDQRSAISGELSAVSYQRSAFRGQLSKVSGLRHDGDRSKPREGILKHPAKISRSMRGKNRCRNPSSRKQFRRPIRAA